MAVNNGLMSCAKLTAITLLPVPFGSLRVRAFTVMLRPARSRP